MQSPGTRLLKHRYQLVARIGAGGMGTVFRAQDTVMRKLVAVKLLHPHLASDPDYLARFHREAKVMQSMHSPHIIRVLDSGRERDDHFLVMEFAHGESLKQILRKRRILPPGEALGVAAQVAQALEEAHAHGVIHRDIKPENIIVGEDGVVKVGDFGIARVEEYTTLTVSGMIAGTPQYMAPESLTGVADERSDIYSLGIVLYEMLTGAPPFGSSTPWEVMRRHREGVPLPIGRGGSAMLEDLEAIVHRCLEKRPEDRYATARELRTALEECAAADGDPSAALDGSTVIARPSRQVRAPMLAALRRALRKRRPVPVVAGIVTVALAGGAIAAAMIWSRSDGVKGAPIEVSNGAPTGWTIDDSFASQDGAYRVVVSRGELRSQPLVAEQRDKRQLSVYRQDSAHEYEVARVAADVLVEGDASDVLHPDATGLRQLSLISSSGASAAGDARHVRILIDSHGTTTVTDDQSATGGGTFATSTPASDALPFRGPLATVLTEPTLVPGAGVRVAPPTATPIDVPASVVPAGWRAIDALWSDDRRTVAVVTASVGLADTVRSYRRQLSIYRLTQGEPRELWREVNAFIDLNHTLSFTDINGDGNPDVVYSTQNGAANGETSGATLAAKIDAGGATDVVFQLPIANSAPVLPIDLNGDGIFEWIAADAAWEENGFSHADSPSSRFVLAWDGHAYIDATPRFINALLIGAPGDPSPPFFVDIGQGQVDPNSACRDQVTYFSKSIARFLDYYNGERTADAARILDGLRKFTPDPRLARMRDWIVEMLQSQPNNPDRAQADAIDGAAACDAICVQIVSACDALATPTPLPQ